jgi:hypothetical protein
LQVAELFLDIRLGFPVIGRGAETLAILPNELGGIVSSAWKQFTPRLGKFEQERMQINNLAAFCRTNSLVFAKRTPNGFVFAFGTEMGWFFEEH